VPHTLTSDELGEAGETAFKNLCSRAKLVCNKSDRDVTGWDFVVEFPMETGTATSLDQRQAAACVIQLKSTAGESGSRVSARLSAIERIAKDPRPAVLVVFRLRSDGEPLMGYCIHLIGTELKRVLRRLRESEARQAYNVNHTTISFDYRKSGTPFKLSPDSMRDALASVCGSDTGNYIIEKQRQLAELGYEEGGIEAEALVWIEGPEHLSRIMLGLEPIKPEKLNAFDTRFGIRIPYDGPLFEDVDELHIEPPLVGQATITIRGKPFEPAAVFACQLYAGPPIPGNEMLVARHPDLIVSIRPDGLNFQTEGTFDTAQRQLADWVKLLLGLTHLASGVGTITMAPASASMSTFTLPVNVPLEGPFIDELPAVSSFLGGWQTLLGMAGIVSDAMFGIDEIWEAAEAGIAVDMLLSRSPVARLEFGDLNGIVGAGPAELLYFNSCRLADVGISYAVKVTIEPTGDGEWRYRSTSFERLDVRPIVSDLAEYGEELAATHSIPMAIDPSTIVLVDQGAGMPSRLSP
jgi:hypothetical protein